MGYYPYGGYNFMFQVVPLIVSIGFIFVIASIIIRSINSAKEWNYNNNSPLLTVGVIVVSKRMLVSQHTHNDTHMNNSVMSTTYYTTFEVDSGDRMELKLPAKEYGMIVEGDQGQLSFQGTRFISFERENNQLN